MTYRLTVLLSVLPAIAFASDNRPALSPFPNGAKSLLQLNRDAADMAISAGVHATPGPQFQPFLKLQNVPMARLPRKAGPEECSIPLLESRVPHPERFKMKILKVPGAPADNMATAPPAPPCKGPNSR